MALHLRAYSLVENYPFASRLILPTLLAAEAGEVPGAHQKQATCLKQRPGAPKKWKAVLQPEEGRLVR